MTASCAPSVKEMNLSQAIVDDLPKEHALSYLRSLSPAWTSSCRFENDGLMRWQPQTGRVFPGKFPYNQFFAVPTRPGVMVVVVIYGPKIKQPWCAIRAEAIADRTPGKDTKSVTGKILTALLSLGVRIPSYTDTPVTSRGS